MIALLHSSHMVRPCMKERKKEKEEERKKEGRKKKKEREKERGKVQNPIEKWNSQFTHKEVQIAPPI